VLTNKLNGKVKEVWDALEKEALVSKMRSVVENNNIHKNINVLGHTQEIFNLFSSRLYTGIYSRGPLSLYLDQRFDGEFTKRELVIVSTLFHDIGKVGYGIDDLGSIKTDKQGFTFAPNHELASCLYTNELLKKYLLFTNGEISYLLFLIRNHSGWPNELFKFYFDTYTQEKVVEVFSQNPLLLEILIYQLLENEHIDTFNYTAKTIISLLKNFSLIERVQKKEKSLKEFIAGNQNEDDRIVMLTNIGSKPWGLTERLAHLSEEIGELFDVYLKVLGLKERQENRDNVISAMSDIYIDFLVLLDHYGIKMSEIKEKCLNDLKIVK